MSAAAPFPGSPAARSFAELSARKGAPGERPSIRKDLIVRRLVQMGEVKWVVKHPETWRIFTFEDGDWAFISRFDGTRTPEELLEEYRREVGGGEVPPTLALDFLEMLRGLDFLEQTTSERALALLDKIRESRKRAADEKAEGFNPFFIMFKVLDPNRFLGRTQKYVRWIWRPPTVALACVTFLFTIGVFAGNFEPIWAGTMELYAFLRKPFWDAVQFFLILTCIGAIHEYAHGYVTRFYGGEVHDIGIALLYFVPAFYCDTTDSLLFESKWQRLWVTIAGIYVEAILCTFATALWVVSYPDTLVHELAYKTMLFTGVSTVFFNINPLIKIDGYHALTSMLEIPELREESLRYLGALVQRHLLRLNVQVPLVSRRKRRIFLVYGPLALAYTGVVMLFIWGLLRNFWGRMAPDLGVAFALVAMSFLFKARLRLLVRTGRHLYLDKKEFLMSRRAGPPLLLAAVTFVLAGSLPWCHRTVQVETTLRPARSASLAAPVDATVAEVRAREGTAVEAGQTVVVLEDLSLGARRAELEARGLALRGEAARRRGAAEAGASRRAEARGEAVAVSLTAVDAERCSLTLSSPFAGRVLTPRAEDLAGRFVAAGTLLVEVGECRTLVADLPVSERLLSDVRPGDPVVLQLAARPLETIRGRVVSVASATSPGIPAGVTPAHPAAGPPLRPPEVPDRVVVRAGFDNPAGALLPGMKGTARIRGARTSFFAVAGRTALRWFQSAFW